MCYDLKTSERRILILCISASAFMLIESICYFVKGTAKYNNNEKFCELDHARYWIVLVSEILVVIMPVMFEILCLVGATRRKKVVVITFMTCQVCTILSGIIRGVVEFDADKLFYLSNIKKQGYLSIAWITLFGLFVYFSIAVGLNNIDMYIEAMFKCSEEILLHLSKKNTKAKLSRVSKQIKLEQQRKLSHINRQQSTWQFI